MIIKLTDFGFAKVDHGNLTTPHFTPYYVSPQVTRPGQSCQLCTHVLTNQEVRHLIAHLIICANISIAYGSCKFGFLQILEASKFQKAVKAGTAPEGYTYTYDKVIFECLFSQLSTVITNYPDQRLNAGLPRLLRSHSKLLRARSTFIVSILIVRIFHEKFYG